MPRPSVERERREQILTAACHVISTTGMHDLRLVDVAREAGVSAGTVHYYFDSKRAVLAEAFAFNFRRSLERRRLLIHGTQTPIARLEQIIDSYLPHDESTVAGWRVWAELWAQAIRDRHFQEINRALYDEWRQMIVAAIAAAQQDGTARAGDPTMLANMLIAMIDGLATQVLAESPDMPVSRMRDTLKQFVATTVLVDRPAS